MAKSKRPRTRNLGGYSLRAVRPPTPRKADWYWRIDVTSTGRVADRGRWPESEAVRRLGTLAASGSPESAPTVVEGVPTLLQLMNWWLPSRRDAITASSYRQIRYAKRRVVGTREQPTSLGALLLDDVTEDRIEEWYHRQVDGGRAAPNVRKDVGYFRAAWSWGRRKGLHERQDLDLRIKSSRANTRPKHNASRGELADLFRHLDAYDDPEPTDALYAMLYTGARPGEVELIQFGGRPTAFAKEVRFAEIPPTIRPRIPHPDDRAGPRRPDTRATG